MDYNDQGLWQINTKVYELPIRDTLEDRMKWAQQKKREFIDRMLAYTECTPEYERLEAGHEIDIVTGQIVA